MEVHHHPNVEKKGFKEYFTQFILSWMPSEATQFTRFSENRGTVWAGTTENLYYLDAQKNVFREYVSQILP